MRRTILIPLLLFVVASAHAAVSGNLSLPDGAAPPSEAADTAAPVSPDIGAVPDEACLATKSLTPGASNYQRSIAQAPADRTFSGVDPGGSRFQADITVDKDNSAAIVSYARRGSSIASGCHEDDVIRTKGWRLALSFPINDDKVGFAQVATLDGLASGIGLEFSGTWSKTPVPFVAGLARDPMFHSLCEKAGLSSRCSYGGILDRLSAADAAGDIGTADMLRTDLHAFRKSRYRTIREYAVSIKVAEDSFDYVTPTLTEHSVDHVGWSVGLSAAFVPPTRDQVYAVGAAYARSYRAGRGVILCPSGSGGAVECVSGPLGRPTERTGKLVWAEARGAMIDLGYSFKVTHDFESGATGIDLPIYLIRGKDGELTGGVRLGWNSEDDFVAGVFLSSPFKLRGQ